MWRSWRTLLISSILVTGAACSSSGDEAAVNSSPAVPVPTTKAPTPSTAAATTTTAAPTTTVAATTTTLAPTTTAAPTTTTEPPPAPEDLPVPAAPPPARADEPVIEVGSIEIPAIGVSKTMYEGISLNTLDRGPGHWPGTAGPGDYGNMVIAGHRTSHDRPFYDLDKLAVGDEVVVSNLAGRFVYTVTETLIVTPDALWITDQTVDKTLTLFACHPKGSTRQRIVIKAALQA